MSRRIGIFGGSFNPVHHGHLKLAREAVSELNLDQVIFVPSRQTPLKDSGELLPAATRARLLKLVLKRYPEFSISLCEIKRSGVSYTVDTLRYFKKKFGGKAVLYFLSGQDTVRNLSRWRKLPEILKLCRFVIFSRPGHAVRVPEGSFLFVPLDALDISASDIRKRLKSGRDIGGLVPAEIKSELKKVFSVTQQGRRPSNTIRK